MSVEPEEYTYEWVLENVLLTEDELFSPKVSFNETEYELSLEKDQGNTNYGCFLAAIDDIDPSDNPLNMHFRFDLVKKSDNTIIKTRQISCPIYMLNGGYGVNDWMKPDTLRENIVKIKIWTASSYDLEHNLHDLDLSLKSSFLNSMFLHGEKVRVYHVVDNFEGSNYILFPG